MDLTAFPRVSLARLPTPIEPLERLAAEIGWQGLFVKRDDLTGLATGGNKTRKLEYALGAALAEDADTVITAGGLQSNHARQTAAAAARVGLACELILSRNAPAANTPDYEQSGNVLLDQLLGARIEAHPAGSDRQALMAARAEALSAEGRKPYVIPLGASYPNGNLGYVRAALEITAQANELDLHFDYLVTATSSGGTLAGLAVGFEALNYPIKLIGVDVDDESDCLREVITPQIDATRDLLNLDPRGSAPQVEILLGHAGGGYGHDAADMREAVRLLASREGLLLDPVYSGKAMAGLIGLARAGRFQSHEKALFLHTGGTAGLFGYRAYFQDGA
jgi:L-cysteate sulfo-lyase